MLQKTTLICFLLTLVFSGTAQHTTILPEKGILPFSGARFFSHGIGGEQLEIKLAEDTWTSNRLPINTDFEVKLLHPTGLSMAEDGNFYPGIEVVILNTKKDTLAAVPNIFGEEGADAEMLKSLTFSLGFNEMSKPGDSCLLFIKFFDTRSANYLLIDFPVVIADPVSRLEVTNSTYSVKSTGNYHGIATGLEMKNVDIKVEEGSKAPFFEIKLFDLSEITEKEYKEGKSSMWTLDGELKEKAVVRKNVSIKATPEKIDLIIKIPLTESDKYIRFRWESADGTKVIDFIGQV